MFCINIGPPWKLIFILNIFWYQWKGNCLNIVYQYWFALDTKNINIGLPCNPLYIILYRTFLILNDMDHEESEERYKLSWGTSWTFWDQLFWGAKLKFGFGEWEMCWGSSQANYNNLDEDNVDIMFKTKLHFQNILSAYFVRIFLQNIMFKTKYYDCENLGQAAPSLCCTV